MLIAEKIGYKFDLKKICILIYIYIYRVYEQMVKKWEFLQESVSE